MVNLFRLLGLPNPNTTPKIRPGTGMGATEPGPKAGNRFHDLGESRWSERTERVTERASRRVIYMEPDGLHRLQLDGVEGNLSMGDMVIIDLNSLTQVCSLLQESDRPCSRWRSGPRGASSAGHGRRRPGVLRWENRGQRPCPQ